MERMIDQIFRQAGTMAANIDGTGWAVISVVLCIAGYMLLKGNAIRGA